MTLLYAITPALAVLIFVGVCIGLHAWVKS